MGGILGLCTGFSIITGVEFFYWFTARIMVDHCTRHKKISPKSPKEREEEPKEDCQLCTELECEMKSLKKELRKQKEATRQIIADTKQQMDAKSKQEIEAIEQQMEAKMQAQMQAQMQAVKKQMEEQQLETQKQFEKLLKSKQ